MSNLNQVFMSGRLVADVTTREVGTHKVAVARLACSRSFKKGDEWQEKTTFIDCEAWDRLAETLSSLTKGTLVSVNGRLESDEWETDGQKRSKLKLNLNGLEVNVSRKELAGNADTGSDAKPEPAKKPAVGRGGFRSNTGNEAEKAKLPF